MNTLAGFEPTCLKEINEIHDALDRSANLQAFLVIVYIAIVELDFKNRQNKRNLALRDKFLVTNYTFMY